MSGDMCTQKHGGVLDQDLFGCHFVIKLLSRQYRIAWPASRMVRYADVRI